VAKIQKIEVVFPVPVEVPPGFSRLLEGVVGMVCEKYKAENPERSMWVFGVGSKPLFQEPLEPKWDDSIYFIEVAEREADERTKELRRRQMASAIWGKN
jgi:hypothetical protein